MAAESTALQELRADLTCPVCLDLFRDPVLLDCGHHFCRRCVRRCWDATPGDERAACPRCRAPCRAREPRPDSLLGDVAETVRRATAGPRDPAGLCAEHREELKLFCEDDQAAVCLVCGLSRQHKAHDVVPVNEAHEKYKEKLCLALQSVEDQRKHASVCQLQNNDAILFIKERADVLERQVSTDFQRLHDFLSAEEKEVKEHLRRVKEEKLEQLNGSLTHITQQMSRLESSAQDIHAKLDQEERPELLTGIKDFIERVECGFEEGQRVRAELQVGEFVGPLQYRVWRKMVSVLDPVVEPVTLDPTTAYPCLHVSPCGRSVRVGSIQPCLPNNPERFTLYNIVLGSQPFSQGRHYWEVEVAGKTAWGLGIAAASVNRKEEISLCPEDGFWTMVLRNGSEYEACTSAEECPLTLTRQPGRVGVYLDYDRGQVSFYNAEDMSHIFSFSDACFEGQVYPYFNPWPIINGRNREPLIIRTLQL
ncbi:zinc-binding protein A33-like [Denticeps clupeoides]|uniref:zinc-binding protein A33-like n=1 Tax=Denticeps clupeoides TaxID=299321 RepID=UPI0010A3659D|nr:zinc-binding protein A33-like [Denticeps clupeoides]